MFLGSSCMSAVLINSTCQILSALWLFEKPPHQREANKGKQHRDDYFYSEIVPTNRIKLFQSERTIYFTILPVAIILIC